MTGRKVTLEAVKWRVLSGVVWGQSPGVDCSIRVALSSSLKSKDALVWILLLVFFGDRPQCSFSYPLYRISRAWGLRQGPDVICQGLQALSERFWVLEHIYPMCTLFKYLVQMLEAPDWKYHRLICKPWKHCGHRVVLTSPYSFLLGTIGTNPRSYTSLSKPDTRASGDSRLAGDWCGHHIDFAEFLLHPRKVPQWMPRAQCLPWKLLVLVGNRSSFWLRTLEWYSLLETVGAVTFVYLWKLSPMWSSWHLYVAHNIIHFAKRLSLVCQPKTQSVRDTWLLMHTSHVLYPGRVQFSACTPVAEVCVVRVWGKCSPVFFLKFSTSLQSLKAPFRWLFLDPQPEPPQKTSPLENTLLSLEQPVLDNIYRGSLSVWPSVESPRA